MHFRAVCLKFTVLCLFLLAALPLSAQAKPRLAVLPFTGGTTIIHVESLQQMEFLVLEGFG
jgi:hypothetical protein